jgi:imidazole glycerol-phosphate synthase subunit HisH
MIGIIDYGLGNIQAFANLYKRNNIPARIVRTPEELRESERLILPGVGSFDWAMARLDGSGLRDALDQLVLAEKRPILGICVGMQMMAESSEEGRAVGLGWIEGHVRKVTFSQSSQDFCLPHMGWNDVSPSQGELLFDGLQTGARFYFLHSFCFHPRDASSIMSRTDYGGTFASGVRKANAYGVQFHPEKSHQWGARLLKNFATV